ncbi:hypothetical protein ACIPY6_34745 [Streptomyces sp. NPDC090054]|uniref:hypothetical protein n=1 Tax=Streptomyces sp. NPDC090054 TaxID=3365933 RepID=UPI003830651A
MTPSAPPVSNSCVPCVVLDELLGAGTGLRRTWVLERIEASLDAEAERYGSNWQ